MKTQNMDWNIAPDQDGKFPDAQVTHSLLMDIRKSAKSMRRMMLFFTVIAVINCVVLTIWVVS